MLTIPAVDDLRALREALRAAHFTEAELRLRITTPPAHAVNATRYYPEGFPGHDQSIDDVVRLLMIGARVSTPKIVQALGEVATATMLDAGLVVREEAFVRATVTFSLWHDLLFVSDREDEITRNDYVMPPEAPAVWMMELIAKHAPVDPKRVLDIGTGCGVLALIAAPTAQEVVGVDSNALAVEFARFNAALNGFANCTFHHTRAQDLSANLGAFDRITFNCPGLYEIGCLQPEAFSVADGDAVLRAVYRILPNILSGVAILRHELRTPPDALAQLLGKARPHLQIQHEIRPHYAGLVDLQTCGVIVTLR